MDNVTVVIMNWMRPQNVYSFAPQYAAQPWVDRVIVWDASPNGTVGLLGGPKSDKIRRVAASDLGTEAGVVARFAAAGLARTPHVMLVDDDIELIERHGAEDLWHDYQHGSGVPAAVEGLFGRLLPRDGTYTCGNVFGPCPIILTRALVTEVSLCCEALAATHKMCRSLQSGEPYGNGEDIVLSYVGMRRTGRLNLALKLPYANYGYDDAHAISVRYAGHEAHRTDVVRWCRENIFDDRKLVS